jgi:nitroreductase
MTDQEIVDHAITSRRSVRGFLPTAVPRATIEEILAVASRAPSGTNIQPWKVHVLTGAARERLCARVMAGHEADYERRKRGEAPLHKTEYEYYPVEWFEPYLGRRRKLGWELYGLLGIGKTDYDKMHAQHGRNYTFFDAPVGLIFSIDRRLQQGAWFDYGTFFQNIMIAARGRGLHTCPQQAFAVYHSIIAEELGLPQSDMVICGMALGHEDASVLANRLTTEREPVTGFATFVER